ncbi:MAG TPA: hypothetical protein VKB13_04375 [Gaiellaceae bacterium]|nr:hypothetical protein [Gaiellaceae bacterium]
MKRVLLILSAAALVLPAAALGKGPSGASVDGPGSGGGITFNGDGESGGTPLGDLADGAGFFPAVFARQPDPMLAKRPAGDLGPKYTITYTVPGPDNETWTITQDLYPYAASGPATYTKPGQTIFQIPGGTHGGWFQAAPQLKETLVLAGLPSSAPSGSADRWSVPTLTLSAFTVLVLMCVALLIVRRRTKPAARMAGSPS